MDNIKRHLRLFYSILLLTAVSCYIYTPYTLIRKSEKNDSGAATPFGNLSSGDDTLYQWHATAKKEYSRYRIKKYFVSIKPESPVARINSKALECALSNMLYESEILLKEAINEAPDEPALYNNLGIVYEAAGKGTQAFHMYSMACMMNQGNAYFRKNFLSLYDYEGR